MVCEIPFRLYGNVTKIMSSELIGEEIGAMSEDYRGEALTKNHWQYRKLRVTSNARTNRIKDMIT